MITEEDRDILESTDPDATMDMGRKVESHMPSDRPGMIMRRRILALLQASSGEDEVSEAVPAVFVPTLGPPREPRPRRGAEPMSAPHPRSSASCSPPSTACRS